MKKVLNNGNTAKVEDFYEGSYHSYLKQEMIVTNHILRVGDFMSEDSLVRLFNPLYNSSLNDVLEIEIASCGGDLWEARQMISMINDHFSGRTTTKIVSHAYSAGAILFLQGEKRVVYPHSELMVHDVSLWDGGKHSDVKNRAKFNERIYDEFNRRLLSPYMTEDEITELLNGKEFWFDYRDMLKNGMATHIIDNGESYEAKDYLNKYPDKVDDKVDK